MGENGYNSIKDITWKNIVLRLLKDIKILFELPSEEIIKIEIIQ